MPQSSKPPANKAKPIPIRLKETFRQYWARRKAVKEAVRKGLAFKTERREILQKKYWSHNAGRFLEHYQSIHAALLKYGSGLEGKNLLHLGSSLGYYTAFLQEHGVNAVALDLNRKMLDISKKMVGNRRAVHATAEHVPIKSGSLDYIISDHFLFSHFHTLNHVELSIIQEAHRTLKKGGLLVIGEARDPTLQRQWAEVLEMGFSRVTKGDSKSGLSVLRKK